MLNLLTADQLANYLAAMEIPDTDTVETAAPVPTETTIKPGKPLTPKASAILDTQYLKLAPNIQSVVNEIMDRGSVKMICKYTEYNKNINYLRSYMTVNNKVLLAALCYLGHHDLETLLLLHRNTDLGLEISLKPHKVSDIFNRSQAPIQKIRQDLENIYKIVTTGGAITLPPVPSPQQSQWVKRTKSKISWGTIAPDKIAQVSLNFFPIKGTEYVVIPRLREGMVYLHIALQTDPDLLISKEGGRVLATLNVTTHKSYSLGQLFPGGKCSIETMRGVIHQLNHLTWDQVIAINGNKSLLLTMGADWVTVMDPNGSVMARIRISTAIKLTLDKSYVGDFLGDLESHIVAKGVESWIRRFNKDNLGSELIQDEPGVLPHPLKEGMIYHKYTQPKWLNGENRRKTLGLLTRWVKNLDPGKIHNLPDGSTLNRQEVLMIQDWVMTKDPVLAGWAKYHSLLEIDPSNGKVVFIQP